MIGLDGKLGPVDPVGESEVPMASFDQDPLSLQPHSTQILQAELSTDPTPTEDSEPAPTTGLGDSSDGNPGTTTLDELLSGSDSSVISQGTESLDGFGGVPANRDQQVSSLVEKDQLSEGLGLPLNSENPAKPLSEIRWEAETDRQVPLYGVDVSGIDNGEIRQLVERSLLAAGEYLPGRAAIAKIRNGKLKFRGLNAPQAMYLLHLLDGIPVEKKWGRDEESNAI